MTRMGHGSRCTGLAAVAAMALAATAPAAAQSCSASATATAFGSYNPQSASPLDSTGSVSFNCAAQLVSLPVNFTVALSVGGGASYAARRMAAGANTVSYQLYTDAGRTTVWGNGTGGTSTQSGSFTLAVATPGSRTFTVYGRMPALQTGTAAGSYSDTITVTVTY